MRKLLDNVASSATQSDYGDMGPFQTLLTLFSDQRELSIEDLF
jgi:hypothetical protein